MVYIKINEKIKEILTIHNKQFPNEDDPENTMFLEKNDTISLQNLRRLHKELKCYKESDILSYKPEEIPKDFKGLFNPDDLVYTLNHRDDMREID